MPRDWDHFESLLRHSLRYGFDHERGGFYFRGKPNELACDTTKFWWVQAEGLSALTDAVAHFDSDEYNGALTQLVKLDTQLSDSLRRWRLDRKHRRRGPTAEREKGR